MYMNFSLKHLNDKQEKTMCINKDSFHVKQPLKFNISIRQLTFRKCYRVCEIVSHILDIMLVLKRFID